MTDHPCDGGGNAILDAARAIRRAIEQDRLAVEREYLLDEAHAALAAQAAMLVTDVLVDEASSPEARASARRVHDALTYIAKIQEEPHA